MSLIDFKQEAQYQGCLHIAVTAFDEINSSLYAAVFDRLCSLPPVQLSGTVLFVRFIEARELPPWANTGKGPKWDEFSAHKQIVGLLGITQCSDVDDLTNAKASLRAAAAEHKPNLLESRCLAYGPKKQLEACRGDLGAGLCLMNCPVERDAYKAEDVGALELEEVVKGFVQDICNRLNGKISMIEKMLNLTGRSEVITLKSPFESREAGMQEEDSSDTRPLSRNHITSRLEKHLGDLYLLTGQLQQASARYRSALPSLKSFKDWLWAGSVHEALSVTAMITKECEEVLGQKAHGTSISGTGSIFRKYTHRVNPVSASLTTRSSSTIDSRRKTPSERLASDPNMARLAKYATTRRAPPTKSIATDLTKTENDDGLVMKTLSAQPAPPPLVEEDEDSGLLDIGDETDGVMESIQYEVEVDGEGEGDAEGEGEGEGEWFIDSRLLQKDFIAKQYSLALFIFKKAGDPGAICRIEALLKFARYLAKQKKCVKAAETLQRILKINSRMITYEDKVDLYITMAEVYQAMNFHRKAAMFTHYAARWVINQAAWLSTNRFELQKQNHNLVYQANTLLVNCLPGYKLSSNLEDLPKQTAAHIGWPSLQACVLKDFVFTSRELQKDIEAINHSCYLLQVLYRHLPNADLQVVTNMLTDIIQEAHDKAKVNETFAASMKGKLASPIPLVNFPLVHSFQPKPLVAHLNPYRMEGFTSPEATSKGEDSKGVVSGPFIYTPFGKKKKENRPEVFWVEEEPGEIAVEIVNPLPYDLKVEKMTVLLEGINTEMYPSTLVLPPGEPQSFVLACIPKEPGLLSILGYKTVVFGVDNQCTVKIPGDPVVRVVPQLPQLRVKVLPSMDFSEMEGGGKGDVGTNNGLKRKMSRSSIDKLELMDGESCQCDFLLESGKQFIDVESLTVSLKDYNKDYCHFSFDQDYINSLLPITKSNIVSFRVTVLAKIPPWFRVMSDATSSFTRKAVGLFDSNSQGSPCTPDNSLKSEFQFFSNNSTPNSSPTPKRTRGAAHALLPFKVSTAKRKSSDSAYSSYNQDSMTLESLDLHIPQKPGQSSSQGNSPTRSINSLGRGVKPPKVGHKRGAVDDVEAALDGFFFGTDSKRASIRSDPGDREESKLSRFTFRKDTPLTHSETKPVAIPKSETAAARLSDLSNGGSLMFFAGGGGGGPSYQPSFASGVLFGADTKTQSLVRGLKSSGSRGKWQPSPSARYISNPIGPLYRENPQPPNKVKVVGEFSLEYSGGQGLQEGFCREYRTNMQIIVKPVLTFEQFDVSLVEGSQSLFKLSFTMTNISKSKLNVTCKINQDGLVECGGMMEYKNTLDPGFSQKLSIAIKRFVVIEPAGSVRNKSDTAKLYSERLSQMIQFGWQEANKRKQGVITLEGLRLATSFISLMRPVPLRFEVSMNGESAVSKGQNSFNCDLKVGEPFKVSLALINNSGLVMPPSFLVLDPYQFSEELKRIVKDLRGKMIVTSCFVVKVPELEPDQFYVHEVTLVFLQRGMFQLDIKSMTPSDENQPGAEGSSQDSQRLDRRTGSCNEAVLSRSPIKKVSKPSNKSRPSLQQKSEKLSVDNKGNKSENLRGSGGNQNSKEKNSSQNSKGLPAILPKKPKPPVSSQGANNKRPPVGGGGGSKEDTNSRTNNELLSVLPSTHVARMISMIERRGTPPPPPVPTSARPKLKPMVANSDQPVDQTMAGTTCNNHSQFVKKQYPTINGSSALAKPVPLSSLNPTGNSSSPPTPRGSFTAHTEEKQEGEQTSKNENSTTTATTKTTKSSTKRKRLAPERMESVILLTSTHSRSQNLWNARLQSSVRLLSGPHFTFNVT